MEENTIKEESIDSDDEGGLPKENPLLKNCRAQIPPLDLFDNEITKLKNVEAEIKKIKDQ